MYQPAHSEKKQVRTKTKKATPSFSGAQFANKNSHQLRSLQAIAEHSSQNQSLVQLKQQAQRKTAKPDTVVQQKENNTGLPDHLKSGIENLSGYAMDDVKVHYNSGKPAQLQAHAYAQGTNIHIASGQEKHLPHEAWHVVQQKQRRVKPTVQLKGGVHVNDDRELENEADVMGAKAIQFVNTSQKVVNQKKERETINGNVQFIQMKNATIQLGGAGSKAINTSGRREAVKFTQQYRRPQMGHLINQTVSPFADLFGDLAAGKIGQHYKDRASDLDKDITKTRIIKFAITETRWWNQQKGIPGWVGSIMSKRMRAYVLLNKAKKLNLLPNDKAEK